MEVQLRINGKRPSEYIDTVEIGTVPLLDSLTYEELLLLKRNCFYSRLKRGTVLYDEGKKITGIYCIFKGVIKVFKIGSLGKEQILRLAHKGDAIAYRSVLTGDLACSTAKVIEEAVVCLIPTHILFQLFEQNWAFRKKMMGQMCKELNESNTFVAEIAQKTVRERTAEMLLYLKDEFGLDHENTIKIRISRVELANMIGTATESLIRVLTEFKNDGLVNLRSKEICILNSNRLRDIADFHIYRPLYRF